MEGKPNFRVVGNLSEQDKEHIKQLLRRRIHNHFEGWTEAQKAEIIKLEVPKTPEQVALIDFANQEINRLRSEFGLAAYTFPTQNFHILPYNTFRKFVQNDSANATSVIDKQTVFLNQANVAEKLPFFGSVVFHETLHMKGHLAWEYQDREGGRTNSIYRMGTAVIASQKNILEGKDHTHFTGLNEAIVSELQQRNFSKMMGLTFLSKEKRDLNSAESQGIKTQISNRWGVKSEDIIWIKSAQDFEVISYKEQRAVLAYVCETISANFKDKYPNADSVYEEFFKAHFTGELLTIARLVEDTFGKGAFRELGYMKDDDETPGVVLASLKQGRYLETKE